MKRFLTVLPVLFLAFVVAPAQAELSPTEVPGATTVDTAKAKQLFDQGVVFIDVRSDSDWDAGRIPGAIHLELKTAMNEQNLASEVAKDQPVVIYCNGEKCMRSSQASEQAVTWGFSNVYYFRDGYPSWEGAGYPVE